MKIDVFAHVLLPQFYQKMLVLDPALPQKMPFLQNPVLMDREKKAYPVQEYSRCLACGRPHSVYRKFKLCRICLRQQAYQGVIPGLKKASW